MNSQYLRIRIAGFLLALVALAGTTWAKDFPQRAESDLKSRREGLGRADVPLLKRIPGRGAETVASLVLQRFESSSTGTTTRGEHKKESRTGLLGVEGKEWSLEVFGDGTRVRYRNRAHLEAARSNAPPVAERLSNERLEALGRRFIAENLQGLVQVGPGEQMLPLYTEFEISGGGSTQEDVKPQPEVVVANTIVFTRTIEGIPVVGAGSKVAVTFTNDGSAAAFELDWPEYQPAGRRQKVLPVKTIRERGSKIQVVDLAAPGVEVSRFECGLFDPGLRRPGTPGFVQAACFAQTIQRTSHGVTAVAHVLPAGDPVEPDPRWPEAMRLLGSNPEAVPVPPSGPSQR